MTSMRSNSKAGMLLSSRSSSASLCRCLMGIMALLFLSVAQYPGLHAYSAPHHYHPNSPNPTPRPPPLDPFNTTNTTGIGGAKIEQQPAHLQYPQYPYNAVNTGSPQYAHSQSVSQGQAMPPSSHQQLDSRYLDNIDNKANSPPQNQQRQPTHDTSYYHRQQQQQLPQQQYSQYQHPANTMNTPPSNVPYRCCNDFALSVKVYCLYRLLWSVCAATTTARIIIF
jgi:hypothetical protein